MAVLAVVGAAVAAVLSPSAGAVAPGATVDQSQALTLGCAAFTPGFVIGQVFTAGFSGRLSDVDLTLGNSAGASGPLHVTLTHVDGAGHPDLAAEIASLDLQPADIAAPGPAGVDLQFGNPSLAAGTQYAIVVSTADPAGYDICGAGDGGMTDFYTGGEAWGTMDGGGSWSDVGGDANFATYMLPLESARAGYCLAGRFLDLAAGQPDIDPLYKGAVLSIFVRGKGITCDPPPPGYTLQGRTTDGEGVGKDVYALYAPAT